MDEFLHENFSSVEASIPLAVSPITELDQSSLGSRLATDIQLEDSHDLPELDDKDIQRWFRMIDAKLDAILQLMHREHSEFRQIPYRKVEISGSGIKVYGPEAFPEGTLVEMRTLLPATPPAAMYLAGKVVRSEEGAIYVKYLPMTEDLRERIIHYVFLRQREILRGKKEL
jgi:hypothetical protein